MCFYTAFNICFYTPLDIFLSNAKDIASPIKSILIYLGAVTLIVFGALFAACILIKGKANGIFRAAIFGIALATHIQTNLLSANMGEIDGSGYNVPVWKLLLNALIWAAAMVLPFIIRRKLSDSFDDLCGYVFSALLLVEVVSLFIGAVNTFGSASDDLLDELLGDNCFVSLTTDFDLYGSDKNFLMIVIDEYDSFCFDDSIKEEPESVSEFDGFTYYTNTVGKFSFTNNALPYIMTGNAEDAKKTEYNNLSFFNTLSKGYDINIYSERFNPSVNVMKKYAGNFEVLSAASAAGKCCSGLYKLGFFRLAPEFMKKMFNVNDLGIEENPVVLPEGKKRYEHNNLAFYRNIPKTLRIADKAQFKYMYLDGLHVPRNLSRNLEYIDDSAPLDTAIGVNKALNEYFNTLKENGVYDSCEILVLADHGLRTGYAAVMGDIDLNAKCPLLLYKPAHQDFEGLRISNAPISHDDLYPTLIKLAGGVPDERTVFDIAEDEERVRVFAEDNTEISINIKKTDSRISA